MRHRIICKAYKEIPGLPESNNLRLELPFGSEYIYKAFLWYDNNAPVCESVSKPAGEQTHLTKPR